jgi:uncharacterized protein (TIGR02453 family)
MPDGFAELILGANRFFADLARNNSRDWYEPRKALYTEEIRKPALLLADMLAEDLSRLTGTALTPKLYRIHRDVRFSKDKTPYNPHLHIGLQQAGGDAAAGWFFGSSPDYLVLCAGLPGLSGAALTGYRGFVDTEGEDLAEAIAEAARSVGANLSHWGAAPLKRVPKPYPPDHPQAELLKRKSLVLQATPQGDWASDPLMPALRTVANGLLPVWRMLDRLPR